MSNGKLVVVFVCQKNRRVKYLKATFKTKPAKNQQIYITQLNARGLLTDSPLLLKTLFIQIGEFKLNVKTRFYDFCIEAEVW